MRQTTRIDTKATNRYKIGKQKLRCDLCWQLPETETRFLPPSRSSFRAIGSAASDFAATVVCWAASLDDRCYESLVLLSRRLLQCPDWGREKLLNSQKADGTRVPV